MQSGTVYAGALGEDENCVVLSEVRIQVIENGVGTAYRGTRTRRCFFFFIKYNRGVSDNFWESGSNSVLCS